MSQKTRLPTLPPPSDPNFSDRLSEVLQVFLGQRGDQLDRVVTHRDLEDQQVAERLVNNGLRRGASAATAGAVGGSTLPVLAIPPAVTGATIGGAFTRMILNWTVPRYANHSYTEVKRSTTNSIASATTIGTTATSTYIDVVGGGFTGYYWLRHVNTDGGVGPWSAVLTATTPASHDEVLQTLTSTQWQASTTYTVFTPIAPTVEVYIAGVQIRLVAVTSGVSGGTEPDWATAITTIGDTVVDGSVLWLSVETGKIPFLIDPVSGLVVIDGAAIREASIESLQVRDGFFDTMTAAKGTLGEANISMLNVFNALVNNYIRSDGYSPGVSGWTINKDGTAEFRDVIARGDVEASSLKAATAMVYAANIASLQVGTIHIQDQAVTFPVYTYSSSLVTVDEGSGWVSVGSSTFTVTGAPVAIFVSAHARMKQGYTTNGVGEKVWKETWASYRVKVNGVVASPSVIEVSRLEEIPDFGDKPIHAPVDVVSGALIFLSTPGAGSCTITVEATVDCDNFGALNAQVLQDDIVIFCIETKK